MNNIGDPLSTNLLNQFRFPDSNMVENILQLQRFTCPQQRLDVGVEILMQLLFSLLMNGRTISHSGIISDLSHSHVEIVQPLMMLDVPVGGIRSIYMKLNADLEHLHSLLPVEVVVADEGDQAAADR